MTNPSSLMAPKFSVRVDLRDEELLELAETMRKGHAGILHPLIARRTKNGLERVVGGRRQRAAKLAGLTSVPVIVRDMDDATAFEAQLIENLHHRGLKDYELGRAFDYMLKSWPEEYPNQETIARQIGKSKTQGWVSQHITAYNTAEELKQSKAITRVITPSEVENLPERHLRALHAMPVDKRGEALAKLIAEKPEIHEAEPFRPPPVRDLEREAEKIKGGHHGDIDTGVVWTCGECRRQFTHVHCAGGRHKLQEVQVA